MSDLPIPNLDAALSEVAEWVAAVNYEQAIARCNELNSSYPDAARVLRARAQAHELSGDAIRASDDYLRVLEILPADSNAMVGLARCQLIAEQPREAAVIARQALDHAPQDADALQIVGAADEGADSRGQIAVARAWFAGGMTNRAIGAMRRLNAAEPDRTDVQVVLAEMLWRSGLKITTAELCQSVLDAQPDCLNAHVMLHGIWSQIGNGGVAEAHKRSIDRLDPDYRETRAWLEDVSPFAVRDVPAQAEQPLPQSDLDAEERDTDADGERDRSAWVDELIAAAGPVSPVASAPVGALAGTPAGARISPVETDLYEGEIAGTAPLEWAPAGADEENGAAEEVPVWLTALQSQAAQTDAPAPAALASLAATPPQTAASVSTPPTVTAAPRDAQELRDAPMAPLEWAPSLSEELPSQPDGAAHAPVEASAEAHINTAALAPDVTIMPPSRKRAHKVKQPKPRRTSDDLLALARKAIEAARYDEAADHYASLVNSGKKLDVVLADLDAATHAYPDAQRFHALLGDCYTRKGDVNAALIAYHRALESN